MTLPLTPSSEAQAPDTLGQNTSPSEANSAPAAAPLAAPLNDPWIAVAHLLRPQGRRGEILAEPLSDLDGLFVPGRSFHMGKDAATTVPVQLQQCWRPQGRNAGRLVLKLEGTDSISAAELLEGQELFLQESLLPPREEGTYLVRDLLGCVLLDGDTPVGTVVDLQFPIAADGHTRIEDAADLLAVHRNGAPATEDPVLIPFVKAWLTAVDLPGRQITMSLPPGLLDNPDAP